MADDDRKPQDKRVSLAPLSFEEAVAALLSVKSEPSDTDKRSEGSADQQPNG